MVDVRGFFMKENFINKKMGKRPISRRYDLITAAAFPP